MGASGGEGSERARAGGATREERQAATLRGAAIGITEVLPLGRIFKDLEIPILKGLKEVIGPEELQRFRDRVGNAVLTGGYEAGQEATAAILQNLNERGYNAERALLDLGVAEEAAIGGSAGAVLQFFTDLFYRGSGRKIGEQRPEKDPSVTVTRPEDTAPDTAQTIAQAEKDKEEKAEAEAEAKKKRSEEFDKKQEAKQLDPATGKPRTEKQVKTKDKVVTDPDQLSLFEGDLSDADIAKIEQAALLDEKNRSAVEPTVTDKKKKETIKEARNRILKEVAESDQYTTSEDMQNAALELLQADTRKGQKKKLLKKEINYFDMVAKEATDATTTDTAGTGTGKLGSRVSVQDDTQVRGKPTSTRTGEVVTPTVRGVGGTGTDVGGAVTGEAQRDDTLKAQPKIVGKRKSPSIETLPAMGAKPFLEELRITGYRDRVVDSENPFTEAQTNTTNQLVSRPVKSKNTKDNKERGIDYKIDNAAKLYFEGRPTPADGIVDAAFDIALTEELQRTEKKFAEEKNPLGLATIDDERDVVFKENIQKMFAIMDEKGKVRGQRSKESAENALEWARSTFNSPEINTFIDSQLAQARQELKDNPPLSAKDVSLDPVEAQRRADARKAKQVQQAELSEEATNKRLRKEFEDAAGRPPINDNEFNKFKEARGTTAKNPIVENKKIIKKMRANARKTLRDAGVTNPTRQQIDQVIAEETTTKKQVREIERVATDVEKTTTTKQDIDKELAEGKEDRRASATRRGTIKQSKSASFGDPIDPLSDQNNGDIDLQDFSNQTGISLGEAFTQTDVHKILRPMEQSTLDAVKDDRIVDALEDVAINSKDKRVKAIANKLAFYAKGLKVRVADKNDAKARQIIAKLEKDREITIEGGVFIPPSKDTKKIDVDNTIILVPNAKGNIDISVLLHEVTHAATYATLQNKSHPLTKQLNALFDQVKNDLPAEFVDAKRSVDEFVAEVFAKPELREVLSAKLVNTPAGKTDGFRLFLHRITNFLRGLLGMPKLPDSRIVEGKNVFDAADSLIQQILMPPSDVSGVPLFMFRTPDGTRTLFDGLSDAINKGTASRKNVVDSADAVLDDTSGIAREAILGFSPLQYLGDIGGKTDATLGRKIREAEQAMLEQRGDVNKSDKEVRTMKLYLLDWQKKNKKEKKLLDRVISISTRYQVDPNKSRLDYRKDEEKEQAWLEMQEDWKTLQQVGGDTVYNNMRAFYKKQFTQLKNEVLREIKDGTGTAEEKRDATSKINQLLFADKELEVYFPLMREGKHKLVIHLDPKFVTRKRDQVVVEMFDTERALNRRMEEVKEDPEIPHTNMEAYVGEIRTPNKSMVPPSSFMGTLITQLNIAGVESDVVTNVIRLYIEALPEASFAKNLQRRIGRPGFIEDSIYVLNRKAYDTGRQIARMRGQRKLRKIRDGIGKYAMEYQSSGAIRRGKGEEVQTKKFNAIVKDITDRINFAINPQTGKTAQTANQFAFGMTIGFNPSSALINLSQIPLFVYPYLGAKYGYTETGTAIHNAAKLVGAALTPSQKFELLDGTQVDYKKWYNVPTLENYYISEYVPQKNKHVFKLRDDIKFPNDEVKGFVERIMPMVQMMSDKGQLNQSFIADEINIDQKASKTKLGRFRDWAMGVSAWGFHNVEQYNRQVTSIGSYLLETDAMKKRLGVDKLTPEQELQAAQDAMYLTQETNGGAVIETGARWSQKDLGRVALMYKNYGIQMYTTMFKSGQKVLNNLLPGTDAESRRLRNEGMKELIGVHLSSLAIAGLYGMPIYGMAKLIAKLFLEDDDEEDLDSLVRRHIGEAYFKGPLSNLTGMDISSRAGLGVTDLLIQFNRYNRDPDLADNLLFYLGGPAGSIANRAYRGIGDLADGEIERGIEQLVPAAFANMYKSVVRIPRDDGYLTRRGDAIYDDVSVSEHVGQFLGFAPLEYTRTQDLNMVSKKIEKAVRDKRTKLLRKYYLFSRQGDWEERRKVLRDIKEFNRKHRGALITPDTIDKSMKRHMKTSIEMYNGVTIDKQVRQSIEQMRDEWNQGWQL